MLQYIACFEKPSRKLNFSPWFCELCLVKIQNTTLRSQYQKLNFEYCHNHTNFPENMRDNYISRSGIPFLYQLSLVPGLYISYMSCRCMALVSMQMWGVTGISRCAPCLNKGTSQIEAYGYILILAVTVVASI